MSGTTWRLSALERGLLALPLGVATALLAFAQDDLHSLFLYSGALACGIAWLNLLLPRCPLGPRVPLALGLVTILCCGTSPYLRSFALGCTFYVGTAMLALQVTNGLDWNRFQPREWIGTALVALLASGIGIFLESEGDRMFWWAHAQLRRWSIDPEAGFGSDPIQLSSLRGVYLSERKVLRLHGDPPRHLRGATYERYHFGRWSTRSVDDRRATLLAQLPPDTGSVVRAEYVGPQTRHLFLPRPVGAVAAADRNIDTDENGLVRLAEPNFTSEYEFSTQGADLFVPGPPRDSHTSVHRSLEWPLAVWLAQNIDLAASPREIARQIESILSTQYTYSLRFERDADRDPLLEFLERDRSGHCEYFASAMTLLARRAGIPARVVAGYYVAERSEVGDYWLVRERDAHAWSELYLDGEWITFDPSPRPEREQDRTLSGWSAWWDAALVHWQAILVSLLPIGFLGLGLSIWWRKRQAHQRAIDASPLEYDAPPDVYRALEARLGERGHPREPTETLGVWCVRVRSAGESTGSDLLSRYAHERYSTGRPSNEWIRDVEDWLRE